MTERIQITKEDVDKWVNKIVGALTWIGFAILLVSLSLSNL